jgi:hypothetical protein
VQDGKLLDQHIGKGGHLVALFFRATTCLNDRQNEEAFKK